MECTGGYRGLLVANYGRTRLDENIFIKRFDEQLGPCTIDKVDNTWPSTRELLEPHRKTIFFSSHPVRWTKAKVAPHNYLLTEFCILPGAKSSGRMFRSVSTCQPLTSFL